jgi:lipid A 4'-phosphatase
MGTMTTALSRAELQDQDANGNVSLLIWGALIVGAVSGVLFFAFPQIDIKTSEYFYKGGGVFAGKGSGIFSGGPPRTIPDVVRLFLYVSFVGVCILNAIGLMASLILKRPVFGLGFLKWLFLALCLVMGPLIVGNLILKDNWGRARPVHITEFGGSKTYTLPLVPSDQCDRNCSFVAGEASMMYAAFFAAAFLFPGRGRRLIAAGVLVGFFSGLIRLSQGAHFLSDVIFAGVTMALTVACIYLLFKAIARKVAVDAQPGPDPLAQWSPW